MSLFKGREKIEQEGRVGNGCKGRLSSERRALRHIKREKGGEKKK